MPIYEYEAKDRKQSCAYCVNGFENLQSLSDPTLKQCPHCGNDIIKLISAPRLGLSVSSLDDRAKAAGFRKLKRLGKGEYEKQY